MNRSCLVRSLIIAAVLILVPGLVCTLSALSIPEVRLWAFGCPDKAKITEVILSRSMCFGTCPNYKLLLRRDGTALYRGGSNTSLIGDYTGATDTEFFDRLADIVQSRGYFKFTDYYTDYMSDGPTYTLSVVCDGMRKTISDYDGSGPLGLRQIEDAVDNVAKPIQWQKYQRPAPPATDPFSSAEWPGSSFLLDL